MEVPLISHFELMTVNPKYLATSSLFKFSIPLAVPTESIRVNPLFLGIILSKSPA